MHVPSSSHKIKLMPVKKPLHQVKTSVEIHFDFRGKPRMMFWLNAVAPRSLIAMHGCKHNEIKRAHPPTLLT